MQSNLRKAFEQSLINMPQGLGSSKTAFENVSFTPKTTDFCPSRNFLSPTKHKNPLIFTYMPIEAQ